MKIQRTVGVSGLVTFLAMTGCDHSINNQQDASDSSSNEDASGAPDTGGGDAGTENALYVVGSGSCGLDTCQTYLLTTPSLEQKKLDVKAKGVELQGFIYPKVYGDGLYVPGGEAPTLTRYTAGANGDLVKGATLSFAAVGLSSAFDGDRLSFISNDKAYLFDEANSKVIVWNPSQMVLAGKEIDISTIQRHGQNVFVSADSAARRRGNLLFVPVGWSDTLTYAARAASGMLVIDTAQDTVVKFLEDNRCASLESSVVMPSGDIYYFTAAGTILDVNAVNRSFPACALRIRADASEFDPSYRLNISEIVGGRLSAWGASGGGNNVYVQVLYEDRSGITDRTRFFGDARNDWRFWRVDLASGQGQEVTSYPWFATSGGAGMELAGGRAFQAVMTLVGDSGGLSSSVARTTTLTDLTSGPEPVSTISIDGSLTAFARIR